MFWKDLHGRHQRAAPVGSQLSLQILDPERLLDVRVVAGVEIVGQLGLQVASVHDDQDGGVAQRRVPAELLAGEDHRQRLAGPCVCQISPVRSWAADWLPDQGHRSVHDFVHRLELLVARDLLSRLALLRLEDDEVLEEVEHVAGFSRSRPFTGTSSGSLGLGRLRLVPPAVLFRVQA